MSKKKKSAKNDNKLEHSNNFDCNSHDNETSDDSHCDCKKGNCSCTEKNSYDSFEAKGE